MIGSLSDESISSSELCSDSVVKPVECLSWERTVSTSLDAQHACHPTKDTPSSSNPVRPRSLTDNCVRNRSAEQAEYVGRRIQREVLVFPQAIKDSCGVHGN